MVSKCLDKVSSNCHIFEAVRNGHKLIQHRGDSQTASKNRRNRGRKFSYFNPVFSNNVKTKLGKEFLKLIKLHFPKNYLTVGYQI